LGSSEDDETAKWDPDPVADCNEDHQDLIRRSFRRQVVRFTGPDSPFAGSPDAPPWVRPLAPDLLVLEVACGAAHVAEMVRICRVGGRVAVNDLVGPEAASRDAFDDLHRALDPSRAGRRRASPRSARTTASSSPS
jgi:hypothetical protein